MVLNSQQIKALLFCTILTLIGTKQPVFAQTSPPECQPPSQGEYLLLILTENQASQERIRQIVPSQLSSTVCRYQGNLVTRIGNFRQIEDAERWGKYLKNSLTLPTVIVRSSGTSSSNSYRNYPAYNPRILSQGYAVLVNYNNQPEMAGKLRDLLRKDIGLVSYRGLPYLLASQHSTQEEAKTILQQLSNQGFWVILVNSQESILLTPVVRY
jgi:hypothetical protein